MPIHLLRWRREKRRGMRKIITEVSPCHEGQHMLPHCVECDAMLQTPPRKATNDH